MMDKKEEIKIVESPQLPKCLAVLRHFEYDHLPEYLQRVAESFYYIAYDMADMLPDGPETNICIRKLLEAKDCAVRAATK